MRKLCVCWPNKEIKSTSPGDDDVYGTIDAVDSCQPAVSFRPKSNADGAGDRKSEPANGNAASRENGASRRSISFGFGLRKKSNKAPNRELPKPPKKPFNRNNIPSIDDPANPTYESIDAEVDSISDPLYSKVDENPSSQRYDYPTFRNKTPKKKLVEEPLYTSASQIYSGGSEDPYSSIVSDTPGPSTSRKPRQQNQQQQYDDSSIYDSGYARVKDPTTSTKTPHRQPPLSNVEIDQLYAKINRPSMRKIRPTEDEPQPGSSSQQPPPRRTTTVSFAQDQTNESGSGSIVSGSSAHPSYRYLTVRETLDVVRERVRQRNQNSNGSNRQSIEHQEDGDGTVREHYYSTIANEYESVGGGSMADSIYGATIPGIPIVDAAHRTASPLTLNVARLSGVFDQNPPRPPTSPIPNRGPPQRTQVLSPTAALNQHQNHLNMMSRSLGGPAAVRILSTPMQVEDRAYSNPNLPGFSGGVGIRSGVVYPMNPQMWQSAALRENPFPRGQPRIIPPISTTSTSFSTSPSKEDYHSRTLNGHPPHSTTTPTRDLVDSETQTNTLSKIPQSTNRLTRQRSQSPVVNAGTQTVNGVPPDQEHKRSRLNLSASPLPLPTGRDYISPVDLSSKRAWPLENNNEIGS